MSEPTADEQALLAELDSPDNDTYHVALPGDRHAVNVEKMIAVTTRRLERIAQDPEADFSLLDVVDVEALPFLAQRRLGGLFIYAVTSTIAGIVRRSGHPRIDVDAAISGIVQANPSAKSFDPRAVQTTMFLLSKELDGEQAALSYRGVYQPDAFHGEDRAPLDALAQVTLLLSMYLRLFAEVTRD